MQLKEVINLDENMKKISLYLPLTLHAQLVLLSLADDTPTARLIRRVLTEYVRGHGKQLKEAIKRSKAAKDAYVKTVSMRSLSE